MQDTVDQAHGAVPRTLADIIEDARRAACGHCCAGSPAWARSFSGTGPDGLHLARFAKASLRGPDKRCPVHTQMRVHPGPAWKAAAGGSLTSVWPGHTGWPMSRE